MKGYADPTSLKRPFSKPCKFYDKNLIAMNGMHINYLCKAGIAFSGVCPWVSVSVCLCVCRRKKTTEKKLT